MRLFIISFMLSISSYTSFSQSKCNDTRCFFFSSIPADSDALLDYKNEIGIPTYFIPTSRTNYLEAYAVLQLQIANQANGQQDYATIFVASKGYWKEIGTIHLCSVIGHTDRGIYFLKGYEYAFSKGGDKPQKIQLLDQNKRWKVE